MMVAIMLAVPLTTAPLCATFRSRIILQVEATELPDAPGARIVSLRCLTCHRADIIRAQRLSRAAWEREVDKMTAWGAQMSAIERSEVVNYLSERFGQKQALATDGDTGASSLLTRCLVCHDMLLIEQQRLTARAWEREVDKMRGWGAAVSDAEAVILRRYLAKRYGPER
jgi:cytochrome c5